MARINGWTLGYTAAGGIILWSGLAGSTLSQTFQALLKGQKPAGGSQPVSGPSLNILDNAGSGSGSGSGAVPAATASGLANDALSYVGSKYVWGGTPGTARGHDNGTDCSGFVNMVAGRDLGLPIPGYGAGGYNGSSHGPVTGQWLLWNGATTIPQSQVQAGDLACWLTHIGIFTDNGQHIVSALDTQSGVVQTTVQGGSPPGEPLTCRRITVTVGAGAGGGGRVTAA